MSAKYIFRCFSGNFLRIFPPGGRVRDAYRRGAGPLGCCRNPGRKNRPATRWLPPGIGSARPAASTITYPYSLAHSGLFLRQTPPQPGGGGGGDPVQPAAGSHPATFLRHWVFPPLYRSISGSKTDLGTSAQLPHETFSQFSNTIVV